MKMLFEFFPIILFFITFKFKGIFAATAVAIVAGVLQIIYTYIRNRKVEPMLLISVLILAVLGGFTIAYHNETFIKWKPTVLYWLFSVVLLTAEIGFRKNLIRAMMEKQMALPHAVWGKLLLSWAGFFAVMGALNLYVAFNYSTDAWVNFKLFGGMGLMLVFVVLQALMLAKYVDNKETR